MGALVFLPELSVGGALALSSPQGERLVCQGVTAVGVSSGAPVAAFVDPGNASGGASNTNTGANATNSPLGTGPILTTAENNKRIVANGPLATPPATIQYLSDDNSTTPALTPPLAATNASFQFAGTPQVLATTTVTVVQAINPPSLREQITTSIADLTPFVVNGAFGGGTSAFPTFFRVVGGPRAGTTAWIENTTAGEGGTVAKVNCSRPLTSGFLATGPINVGDTVQICRPSNITIANVEQGLAAQSWTATFLRMLAPFVLLSPGGGFHEGSSFDLGFTTAGGNYVGSWVSNQINVTNGQASMNAGTYWPTAFDSGLQLILLGDVYVGPVAVGVIAGPDNWQVLLVEPGFGSGVQCWTQGTGLTTDAGITCLSSQILGAAQPGVGHAFAWGTCSAGTGILIGQGATVTVSGAAGFHPTLSGSSQAYAWLNQGISGVVTLRTSAETASATAYSGTQSTITYGPLFNAGLLNGQAHNIQTNAHMIAYQG